jgi:hypothetical protein
MSDDISFSNMDSWRGSSSGKFGLTFKQICLLHINRCVQNGSVEWHGGYWQEKTTISGVDRIYVQDSREVYCNSVKMLRALLLGYFDKKVEERDKELLTEYNSKLKEYESNDSKSKEDKYKFYEYKIEWHIKLFEQLILLSKRLNFFEEESVEEEM